MNNRGLNGLALALLIIGGLNWLLVGLFKWDLVGGLTGGMNSMVARVVYVIVGLAAIYAIGLFGEVTGNEKAGSR
jgi:uncharacterized membrane protein YuzA (DUF378 family)